MTSTRHAMAALMQTYQTAALLTEQERKARPYFEFLRVAAMSAGIYVLRKGTTDPQSPHSEDEAYVVLQGRARIRVGADDRTVEPGTIVYVPAHLEHRFHDIEETLTTLVFFAPAETPGNARSVSRTRRDRSSAKS